MTDAPRRILAFLSAIDLSGYSRERVCRATKLSPRTISRALGKLVEIGAIDRQRGGRSTAAKITVLISMEAFLAHQVEMAHYVAKSGPPKAGNGPLSGHLNLKEVIQEQESKPARKPMAVEIPREHITNEYGRPIVNPTWQRTRDAIRAGYQSGRIQNARNREAYIAAIIRGETKHTA